MAAAGAALVAAALSSFGPPGVDLAAHLYQRALFVHHGYVFWDNDWYAGRYGFVTYSVSYYPLAAVFGIRLLALVSVSGAAGAYAGAVRVVFNGAGRWSLPAFSVLTGALVLSAAYPFLLGEAFGLWALWSLALWWRAAPRRRAVRGVLFSGFVLGTVAAASASPLALLGVLLVVAAASLAVPGRRTLSVLSFVVVVSAAEALVLRAFPGEGFYPFWGDNLAEALVFSGGLCVLSFWAVPWRKGAGGSFWRGTPLQERLVVAAAVVFAAASLVAFFVPSPLGANLVRIREAAVAVVTVAAALRGFRPRWLVALALAAAAWWNLVPLASAFVAESKSAEAQASYWEPAVRFLKAHLRPSYRVEVVDTVGHDGAFFLPQAGIPIARGWFRQEDFPTNALFYRERALSPTAYRAWLRSLGVAYVVLTDAPPDFSAADEAALLRSGRSGLHVVLRAPQLTVFALAHPTPMLVGPGPARVVRLGVSHVVVVLGAPGAYRLALHWSPYWHASAGCVAKAPGDMTELVVDHPGQVRLGLRISPGALARTVLGGSPASCPSERRALSFRAESALR